MAASRSQHGTKRSIRGAYEQFGVAAFYQRFGWRYHNPHEAAIDRVLRDAVATWSPSLEAVLDLACGSGVVTAVLRSLGAPAVSGVDPYTAEAYRERTGSDAERFSFEEIAAGAMSGRRYSLIVCSFALHLLEASRLAMLAYQLSMIGDSLLILTPHKRPVLKPEWGWRLEGEVVIERIRARFYRTTHADRFASE